MKSQDVLETIGHIIDRSKTNSLTFESVLKMKIFLRYKYLLGR